MKKLQEMYETLKNMALSYPIEVVTGRLVIQSNPPIEIGRMKTAKELYYYHIEGSEGASMMSKRAIFKKVEQALRSS